MRIAMMPIVCYNQINMQTKLWSIFKILIVIALFIWFGAQLAKKIDLTTADLGRHIQNGRVIISGSWADKRAVLNTNFYSYTLPNQSFVNHHWLSGVIFYLLNLWFGFAGLSVFYILLGMLTFWLYFLAAKNAGGFWLALLFGLLLVPLMATRTEVRPEMFTYLFSGVFYFILAKWRTGKLVNRWLLILPAVMLFWVNLHIGFVFGFLILGAFGLEQLVKYFKHQPNGFAPLVFFGGAGLLASLINPFGYKALFYPLNIFKNYGYLVTENQSVKFLENLGFTAGEHFLLFKLVAVICAVSAILLAFKNVRKIYLPNIILVGVSGVMAFLGIRHFPSFAFFVWPFLSGIAFDLLPWERIRLFVRSHLAYRLSGWTIGLAAAVLLVVPQWQAMAALGPALGFGLLPGSNSAAEFFIKSGLTGPIFNNYDIGGYLIYNLYPAEKVFVDNRPEAYTTDFFENIYKAAQTDESKWAALDKKYNFNVIFFSHRDYTPWAQAFLISRIQDPLWVPVFADSYNIILLKKNKVNVKLIQKYYIPKENFQLSRQ